MKHLYYGIYDNVAKCYAWVGENKNNETFTRMCNMMQEDKSTFIGQSPADYVGYKLAQFEDETGAFENDNEKVWEGRPHE